MDVERFDSGFMLGPNHCLHLFWGATEQGSAGVRLSTSEDLPAMAWTADGDGMFITRTPFTAQIEPGWRHVRVAIEEGGAYSVSVNGSPMVKAKGPRAVGRVGFRGCLDDGWVDDVRIRGRDGRRVAEDWDAGGREAVFAAAFLVLLLGGGLIVLLARWIAGPASLVPWLGALLALVAVGIGATMQQVRNKRTWGFEQDAIEALPTVPPHELTDRIAESLPSQGPRILFVGTGQTAGRGTTDPGLGFVERTCALLPPTPDGPWTCLRGGLPGGQSPELFKLTRDQWMKHQPTLLVLTLGGTETDLLRYRRSVVRFAQLAAASGAQVVLTIEPTSPEAALTWDEERRAATGQAAQEQGLALVDLHRALVERQDDGLLWWDRQTLSGAGHRVVAEELARALGPLLAAPTSADQPSAQKP